MKSTKQSGRDTGQTTSDWSTRTGANQIPSPPSDLALRPPPRSGFVQWQIMSRGREPGAGRPRPEGRSCCLRSLVRVELCLLDLRGDAVVEVQSRDVQLLTSVVVDRLH